MGVASEAPLDVWPWRPGCRCASPSPASWCGRSDSRCSSSSSPACRQRLRPRSGKSVWAAGGQIQGRPPDCETPPAGLTATHLRADGGWVREEEEEDEGQQGVCVVSVGPWRGSLGWLQISGPPSLMSGSRAWSRTAADRPVASSRASTLTSCSDAQRADCQWTHQGRKPELVWLRRSTD